MGCFDFLNLCFAEIIFIFRIFFLVITLTLQVKNTMWGKYWLWTLKGELYKLLFPLGYLLYVCMKAKYSFRLGFRSASRPDRHYIFNSLLKLT